MGLWFPECYSACLERPRFWVQYPEVHKRMIHTTLNFLCKEFVSGKKLPIVQGNKTQTGTSKHTLLD